MPLFEFVRRTRTGAVDDPLLSDRGILPGKPGLVNTRPVGAGRARRHFSPSGGAVTKKQAPADQPGAGMRIVNVLPCPGALSTVTVPPWTIAMCWTIASPSPEPPRWRLRPESTR